MENLDTRIGEDQQQPEPFDPDGLDRLSLVQALRDFEVANGRVIDLTQRLVVTAEGLVAAREALAAAQAERDELRVRLDDLTARFEELSATHARTLERKSVRLGEAVWSARQSVRNRRRGRDAR